MELGWAHAQLTGTEPRVHPQQSIKQPCATGLGSQKSSGGLQRLSSDYS